MRIGANEEKSYGRQPYGQKYYSFNFAYDQFLSLSLLKSGFKKPDLTVLEKPHFCSSFSGS